MTLWNKEGKEKGIGTHRRRGEGEEEKGGESRKKRKVEREEEIAKEE